MPAETPDEPTAPGDPYLTIDQAAARLKVKRTTLAKWRVLGRGPAYRDHGVIVYHIDDLDAWSREQRRTQTPKAAGKEQPQTPPSTAGESGK